MRAEWFLMVGIVATIAVAAPGAAQEDRDIEIVALSNRADLVSGGDALLEVRLPDDLDAADVRVNIDGRDVTSAFAVRRDGRFVGLVHRLRAGKNTITATSRTKARAVGARLEVTNHAIGGPVFSGPQIKPWYCLPEALDKLCNRPVRYEYFYKSATPDGSVQPYDPGNPPSPPDVATTTTDEGKTVPYVWRVETGNMNRNQYRIAVLARPGEQWTRWTGPPAWNHKVYALHGAGCSMSHIEGEAQDVMSDTVRGLALSRGLAVLAVAMADNTYSCNVVVQAESVMMAKEHLIESYGDIRYLFGTGGSGGSMAQLHMANAYPGLYDGLIVNATFPDVPTNDLMDCPLLLRYWDDPLNWEPGIVWLEPQQAAAAGHAATSVCRFWVNLYSYPRVFDPVSGVGCRVPEREPSKVYDPQDNPRGVRCSLQDYMRNVFGLRPKDRWGPVERGIERGFANRPYDNVGVQYGLRALLAGDITPAQFVDLNAKIGSLDIDYGWQPKRVEADPGALATAYRAGFVNEANNLDRVPIIDVPGGSLVGSFPGDRYEIHDNYKSWALRERLDAANGHHDNHVIWYGLEGSPARPYNLLLADSFATMDAWLDAVERDDRNMPLEEKVAANRPDEARDLCELPNRSLCDRLFGPAANPRWGAGAGIANDVIKCRLTPLVRSDYYPILFTDAEWEALRAAFPSGVCDWSRRGVGQQPGVGWQAYTDGPGGHPLGAPPASVAFTSSGGAAKAVPEQPAGGGSPAGRSATGGEGGCFARSTC